MLWYRDGEWMSWSGVRIDTEDVECYLHAYDWCDYEDENLKFIILSRKAHDEIEDELYREHMICKMNGHVCWTSNLYTTSGEVDSTVFYDGSKKLLAYLNHKKHTLKYYSLPDDLMMAPIMRQFYVFRYRNELFMISKDDLEYPIEYLKTVRWCCPIDFIPLANNLIHWGRAYKHIGNDLE